MIGEVVYGAPNSFGTGRRLGSFGLDYNRQFACLACVANEFGAPN